MLTKSAPKIQSTVYPPSRLKNEIREGGLWYSEKQNQLLDSAKRIVAKPRYPKEKLIRKLIIVAIVLDVITLIHLIWKS